MFSTTALLSAVELLRDQYAVVAAALLVLVLFPWLLSLALEQWRLYWAFKHIPCDPDQHFLLGHGPKYYSTVLYSSSWLYVSCQ